MPSITSGSSRSSYYGMNDVPPDEHQIIDSLETYGPENIYCCVGLSGHGFKLSLALGLITSELVLGTGFSLFDGSVFGLNRFSGGNSLFNR